ncbi:MAG: TlpA disulfide reductase family protein [Mariprofundales bacterium]|nr:TlpA disulfide reductase family protein [Mariprofundales bacterium]
MLFVRESRGGSVVLRMLMAGLALFMLGCSSPSSVNGALQKGEPFPQLMMRDLTGGVGSSAELFHGKVVVFNVWATWCPPCRKEMPDLVRLSRLLPNSDFVVLGLSVDEDLQALQRYIAEHGITFPIYWDQGGGAIAAKRLQVFKYPETFILNRDGVLVERVIGAFPWASDTSVKLLKYIAKHGVVPQ